MEIQIGNQAFQGERIKEVLDLPSLLLYVQSSVKGKCVFYVKVSDMEWNEPVYSSQSGIRRKKL